MRNRSEQVERTLVFEIHNPGQEAVERIDELAFMICRMINVNPTTQKDQIFVEYVKDVLKISIRYERGSWALKVADKMMDLGCYPNVTRIVVVTGDVEMVYLDRTM